MKYKIKQQRGLTLIELIIVLTLLVTVLSVGFSLYMFSRNALSKGEKQSDAQSQARIASLFITNELRTAETVKIYNKEITGISKIDGRNYIYFDEGEKAIKFIHKKNDSSDVEINKKIAYTEKTPEGQLKFKKVSDKIVSFDLTIAIKGQTYKVESQINPLNLAKTTNIDGDITGITIEYTKPAVDDAISVTLDTDSLDLKSANAYLVLENDGSLTLKPPNYHPSTINLPKSGKYGSTITWDDGQNSDVIKPDGTVTRPMYLKDTNKVTLTATIKKGIASSTKIFKLNIDALEDLIIQKDTELSTLDGVPLLPVATNGQSYEYIFNTYGGQPGYTYTSDVDLSSFGLILESSGKLSGTATLPDEYKQTGVIILFNLKVDDSYSNYGGTINNNESQEYYLQISNVTTP